MSEANIENGVATCPFCGSKKFEVYRRSPEDNGNISCLARCLKCDDTFVVVIDKYNNPIKTQTVDDDYPDLPFGGC